MHLGQTASFLASVLNRPEPKTNMVARILREGGWVRKGARGNNAPHTNSEELSKFLITIMASPDSPATGLDRLPHFWALPLDPEAGKEITFGSALAILLDRLASETWEQAEARHWRVQINVSYSKAVIMETHASDDGPHDKEHAFAACWNTPDDVPAIQGMPYFSGLDVASGLGCLILFRIAKVILANEADPLDAIAERLERDHGEGV